MNAPLWFSNLLFWSAQVALIAIAAWLLVRLLRIRDPRVLVIQWRALILASLLLPFIEPWRRLPSIPALSFAPAAFPPNAIQPPAPASPHWNLLTLALLAQIIGAVILLAIAFRFAMLAIGLLKLRQLRRASSPVPAHLVSIEQAKRLTDAHAEFCLSAHVESPVTFGFSAPLILLPERFLHLDADSQSAIACHELLHIRRHDWAHHLAEEILRALFWFHPAILWLIARVRLAREQLVDLEVVRLTQARKTYLNALLEFTAARRPILAIPAPPFLVERQLVERVSLMLKEVRMSRTRLIASLSTVACLLAACAIFAVSVFPLKAAPRPQNPISQTAEPAATNPVVDANTIWTAKVKQGAMPIEVRGLAKLVSSGNSEKPVVRVSLSESMMADVHVGQSALVDTHKGVVRGHVSSVSREVIAGVRTADVNLDSPLPSGSDSSATFDVTIVVGKLENVVYVGRPALFNANSEGPVLASIFKIAENGNSAQRVTVQFGRASVNTIQVLSGLNVGDTVILSDMSPYDKFSRIQIKR